MTAPSLQPLPGDPQRVSLFGRARGMDLRESLASYGSILFLVLMCVYFSVRFPSFRTAGNFADILAAESVLALMAFGLTILMAMFEFDLSVGYVASFAAVVATTVARDHQSTYLGFGVGIALAIGCGLVNGMVVTILRIPSFMATLAMGIVWYGLNFAYSGGYYITGVPANFTNLGLKSVLGLRWVVIVAVVALALAWVLLERTIPGRRMYAVGGNALAARLSGVNLARIRMLGFVMASLGAGLAGITLASSQGAASTEIATSILLDAFTAVFLGASVVRGRPHLLGTAVGVVILGVLDNGMTLMNLDLETTTIVRGVVLLSAIAMSQLRRTSE